MDVHKIFFQYCYYNSGLNSQKKIIFLIKYLFTQQNWKNYEKISKPLTTLLFYRYQGHGSAQNTYPSMNLKHFDSKLETNHGLAVC